MKFTYNQIGFIEIKEILSKKDTIFKDKILNIELDGTGELYGEIDQLFISYSLLFLKTENGLSISVNFKNTIESSKFFKFAQQIKQAKVLYPKIIYNDNFLITGAYVVKETGEIKNMIGYEKLSQSASFIPPLLIYKSSLKPESIDLKDSSIHGFFKKSIDLKKTISQLYFNKNIEIIKAKLSDKDKFQSQFIEDFIKNSKDFSFVKICILRILFDLSLFEKKGNKKNVYIFKSLEVFTNNIITGLEELANNIIQHSGSSGVITVRKFETGILDQLKKQRDVSVYLEMHSDHTAFLDINIIDLGTINIKEHYTKNLEKTKEDIINSLEIGLNNEKLKGGESIQGQYKSEIITSLKVEFDNDIEIVKQKDFAFKNFFIKEKEKGIDKLSSQQNKFITKIGLQYFTSIIKDTYKGFIQVSSGQEKTILYTGKNKELITNSSDNTNFILLGTFYSCYVPIQINIEQNLSTESNKSNIIDQDPNSFSELRKYTHIKREDSLTKFKEEITNQNRKENKILIDFNVEKITEKFINAYSEKYGLYISLYTELLHYQLVEKITFSKSQHIIAISCKELQMKYLTNGSEWIRYIWTLSNFFENIILYDIDLVHFVSIIHLRNQFAQNSNLNFWDEDSRVLFYSKKNQKNDTDYYRYGVNILAGNSIKEFSFLNRRIWLHHYSFKIDKLGIQISDSNSFKESRHLKSPFFTVDGRLKYFEVLLSTSTKNEDKISLFAKSVQYSLNTLLEEKHNDHTNNRGYKISNTHFRLGSKIHISDFYYAKKLFQNSFFTTPLAFSIAQDIFETHIKKLHNINEVANSFTLVGYEEYSSFLVSSIRNFLEKFIVDFFSKIDIQKKDLIIKINHLIIDKDGNISIDSSKLQQKVLLIIPIASTFKTALKIEDQLNEIIQNYKKNLEVVSVISNSQIIVWVGHRDENKLIFENYFDNNGNVIKNELKQNIYENHDWVKIDKINKLVKLKRYNVRDIKDNERTQKYLVPVYTTWHESDACKLCYPINANEEKCLIETGKASITPQVIFGFPKTKQYNSILKNTANLQLSLDGALLYGYLSKRANNYLFYTRTGKVVEKNETVIERWIEEIKTQTKDYFYNQKVVIVTPNTGSKSKFLDLINEHLFEYAANCITISLKEDYIENAETLYSDGIFNADIVVYVDDVLSTIKSFLEVNYIIKYIRDKINTGKGIDFCISLINRMSFEDEDNLQLKLADLNHFGHEKQNNVFKDKLIYLQKDYLPNIEEANNEFPLKLEREKYKNLEKNSSLDQVRNHFHNKRSKLQKRDLLKSIPEDIKDYSFDFSRKRKKRNKKLYQYLLLNALYRIFKFEPFENLKKYKDDRDNDLREYFPVLENDLEKNKKIGKNSLIKLIDRITEILKKDYQHQYTIQENKGNIDFVILKVICSTPLIYYKPIRENALNWIFIKLEELLKKINELSDIRHFYKVNVNSDFSYYQDLKFLLKKSVKLRSNFIIHSGTFEFYKELIDNINAVKNWNALKKENQLFRKELQKLTTNTEYLSNPYIHKKLYDFVRNNLKDGIFESIIFDKYVVTKQGLYERKAYKVHSLISKEEELGFHRFIIANYKEYSDGIPLIQSNTSKDIRGQISFISTEEEVIYFKETVKSDDSEIYKKFKKEFENLDKTYRFKTSTSKNLIVNLVALVQELTYEHEVKSIKLDEVIRNGGLINNENGTYKHLLRLLNLENIEIINKHSLDLIQNHKFTFEKLYESKFKEEELKNRFVKNANINETLKLDKKYKELCNLQKENKNVENSTSIDSFIALRKYLIDTLISDEEDKIELKMEIIATKIKKIINGNNDDFVEDIFFTVNYKDFEKYEIDDTYTFSLNNNSPVRKGLIDDNNSLTALMGQEKFITRDEHLFSHFEIIKNEKGELICRDDEKIKKIIIDTDQFKNLGKNKSILLIRISDFMKESNSSETKFNTRSVLTIYLNQNSRLHEKRLRLLLALRTDLLKFIKRKTQGSTFLELLQLAKKDAYFDSLKHDFEGFYDNQTLIKNNLFNAINTKGNGNNFKLDSQQFDLITETLKLQTFGFSNKNILTYSKYSSELIKNYICLTLSSTYIYNNMPFEDHNIIIYDPNQKSYNIPDILIKTVLLQLISNLKKYTQKLTDKYTISINCFDNRIEIILNNVIDFERIVDSRNGTGNDMCRNIIETINSHSNLNDLKIKNVHIEYDQRPDTELKTPETFIAKIKIIYHEI